LRDKSRRSGDQCGGLYIKCMENKDLNELISIE
jgi:hypothetical protein